MAQPPLGSIVFLHVVLQAREFKELAPFPRAR
jgi:hypothetical protein